MPSRRDRLDYLNSPAAGAVFVFPGLSIMQHKWLSAGTLLVKCPGCGASLMVSSAAPPTTFVHEDDDCPILRRIEAAIALFNSMPEDFE
jgi:hypothetical protein